MAHYEHLPIYRKTLELAIFMENCVKGSSEPGFSEFWDDCD